MISKEKKIISTLYNKIIKVSGKPPIYLHEPKLDKKDIGHLRDCIKSGYISTGGKFINEFEKKLCAITKAKYCVAIVNGTSALHIALRSVGVESNHEVLLPSFNFIAAANAVLYCNAIPHFIEISEESLFIDELKLRSYLKKIVIFKNKKPFNKNTGRLIKAAIPMHTFGHTGNILEIKNILNNFNIKMIEDAAEALGSYYKNKHAGTFGHIGILSFNGNKIISTGGGGAILTNNKSIADKAKHISNVSKKKHLWKFEYDQLGYNYRLPNLNAALGCSQLKKLNNLLIKKRKLKDKYLSIFKNDNKIHLFLENKFSKSNYWLQSLIVDGYSRNFTKVFLDYCNKKKLFLRPAWCLLHKTKYLKKFPKMNLLVSEKMHNKVINLPSSCY